MRALYTLTLGAVLAATTSIGFVQAAPMKAAVIDFELVDSSQEGEMNGVRDDQTQRLKRTQEMVQEALKNANVEFVDMAPARDQLKDMNKIYECLPCAQRVGSAVGADVAVVGHVQKVSNLILNINVQIVDVKTGKMVRGGSADIRGNTDESWEHGTKYLMKRNILKEPLPEVVGR